MKDKVPSVSTSEGAELIKSVVDHSDLGVARSSVRMCGEQGDALTSGLGYREVERGSRLEKEGEVSDEENLSEPYEAGSSSDDRVDKILMMVQGLLSGMKKERDARKNTVLGKGMMVDRILPYRNGADISHLL